MILGYRSKERCENKKGGREWNVYYLVDLIGKLGK